MIIGHGLLGQALRSIDSSDIIFFASGVSNSGEKRKEEFDREAILLSNTICDQPDKTLVYFSTCSVSESSLSMYSLHKLKMEQMIQKNCNKYVIFRLPQVVGHGGNPNTLLNFLIDKIIKNEPFDVWYNVKRNFISVDDIVFILNKIILDNCINNSIINIASPYSVSMIEVIHLIENYFDTKAIFNSVDKGEEYTVDISEMEKIIDKNTLFLENEKDYITKLLTTYYPKENY